MTPTQTCYPFNGLKHWRWHFHLVYVLAVFLHSPAYAQEADNTVHELSPFVVSEDSDVGYLSTESVSGSRLNTPLRDIPSSVSQLSSQLLDDIGAYDFEDAVSFVPSGEKHTLDSSDMEGFQRALSQPFISRGFQTASRTIDFFNTSTRIDRFSTENAAVVRGPNSLLFGIGNPGGLFAATAKTALFSNHTELLFNLDTEESYRAAFDINRELVEDGFAIRLTGVTAEDIGGRDPESRNRDGLYGALTIKPFKGTKIRVNAEIGSTDNNIAWPTVAQDWYTPWVEAGKPLYSGSGPLPAGLEFINTNNDNYITVIEGTNLPVMDWGNQTRGARATDASGTRRNDIVFTGDVDLGEYGIFPIETNLGGAQHLSSTDYDRASILIEQRLAEGLYLELGASQESSDKTVFTPMRQVNLQIKVDTNMLLPDGNPNPYAGRPYIDQSHNWSLQQKFEEELEELRATLAYEFDLREVGGELFNFGRHKMAALISRAKREFVGNNYQELNTTPVPGARPNFNHPDNWIRRRYYLGTGGGLNHGYAFASDFEPISQSANGPYPGVEGKFISGVQPPEHSLTQIDSLALGVQSYFLQDKLVLTYGFRSDDNSAHVAAFKPTPNAQGRVWPEADFDSPLGDPYEESGDLYSAGVVYHLNRHLSVFYNQAENFQPGGTSRSTFAGDPLPSSTGDGEDYGIKFNLFDDRLVGVLTRFSTSQDFVAVNPRNNYGGRQNRISNVYEIERSIDPDFIAPPSVSPLENRLSEGYELELVANPLERFTVRVAASYNETRAVDILPVFQSYFEAQKPYYLANGHLPSITPGVSTVAEGVARIEGQLASQLAEEGQLRLNQAQWLFSTVASYTFDPDSALKGWSVGTALHWRDKPIIFYGVNPDGFEDLSLPVYGVDSTNLDVFVAYRGSSLLGWDVGWSTQLRVENILEPWKILPLRGESDGQGGAYVARANITGPLRVALQTTFSF